MRLETRNNINNVRVIYESITITGITNYFAPFVVVVNFKKIRVKKQNDVFIGCQGHNLGLKSGGDPIYWDPIKGPRK
jgi:hypothetical protein